MTSMTALRQETFASLSNRNYRRYSGGQAISLIGTWMQTVAQSWLVFQLTGSATAIGLVVALQTLPTLFLGPYGGVIADRMDKRKLMMILQALMGLTALLLGVLTITHTVELWHVYVLAVVLGINSSLENPARQTFVLEMVGPADLRNAVSLNSVLVNAARAVGPAVGGLIIAAGGIGFCFILNALSFVAVITSLARLDVSALAPSPPSARKRGQLREGFSYVRHTPELAVPLVMMAIIGCLAYEFQVVLPILAEQDFHSGPKGYGFMTAVMGFGAVLGGLWIAARGRTGHRAMVWTAVGLGVTMLASAAAPTLAVELVVLAFVGASSVAVLSTGNSTLQLLSAPHMRGRVMALWAVAFLGSTPIGGPIAGAVSQYFGARIGLAMGGLACLVAAVFAVLALRPARSSDHPGAVVASSEPTVAL